MQPHVAVQAIDICLSSQKICVQPSTLHCLSLSSCAVRRVAVCRAHSVARRQAVKAQSSAAGLCKAAGSLGTQLAAWKASDVTVSRCHAGRADRCTRRRRPAANAEGSSSHDSATVAVLDQQLDEPAALPSDRKLAQDDSMADSMAYSARGYHDNSGNGLDGSSVTSANGSCPPLRQLEGDIATALEAGRHAAAFDSYCHLLEAGGFPADATCEKLLKGE